MAITAIVFDVDGTLIDSNGAHLQAWEQAFKQNGFNVPADRIAGEIGKGGEKLVPSILGDDAERRLGDALRAAEADGFTSIAKSKPLTLFPGVKALLQELRQRGLKTAVATSSQMVSLKTTFGSAGADLGWFDVIISADDADEGKPAPHLLQAAFKRLGVPSAQGLTVGDTPYDIISARDSGAVGIGVTAGGFNDANALRGVGARRVYRDIADLHAHLDQMLEAASPGRAVVTEDLMTRLMREALSVAKTGLERGEAPIGCVIATGDGSVVARGHNASNATQDRIAHAEIVAFRELPGRVPPEARDLILVSTLEPCVMCLGAAMEAGIDTVIYGLPAPADGGRRRVQPPVSPESVMPRIIGNTLPDASVELFEQFLRRPPINPQQLAFTRQLLAMVGK